jgi:hypothetical protein
MITVHQTLVRKGRRDETEIHLEGMTECQKLVFDIKQRGYEIGFCYFKSPSIDEPHLYLEAIKK